MRAPTQKRSFAARPADAEGWIKTANTPSSGIEQPAAYTARLTIDITPELRGRIKIAAFRRGGTVADMLAREFPPIEGETP